MALGNNSNQNSGTLFILKFVTQDKDKKKVPPHFSVSEKVDGKWKVTKEVTRVSGNLYKIDIKEAEFKGEKYNTVALYFKDGEEAYLVDFRMNLPARSVFNSLLSLDTFEDVSLTAYEGKNGYPAIGVWQGTQGNSKMVRWKYKLEELPAPETVKFKGKEMNDYTAVDNFFIKELSTLGAKLGGGKGPKPSSTAPASAPTEKHDDIPF